MCSCSPVHLKEELLSVRLHRDHLRYGKRKVHPSLVLLGLLRQVVARRLPFQPFVALNLRGVPCSRGFRRGADNIFQPGVCGEVARVPFMGRVPFSRRVGGEYLFRGVTGRGRVPSWRGGGGCKVRWLMGTDLRLGDGRDVSRPPK